MPGRAATSDIWRSRCQEPFRPRRKCFLRWNRPAPRKAPEAFPRPGRQAYRPSVGMRRLVELHRPEIFRSDISPVRRAVRRRAEPLLRIRDLDGERLLARRRAEPRFERLIGQGGRAVLGVEPRRADSDDARQGGKRDVRVEGGDRLAGESGAASRLALSRRRDISVRVCSASSEPMLPSSCSRSSSASCSL